MLSTGLSIRRNSKDNRGMMKNMKKEETLNTCQMYRLIKLEKRIILDS